MKRPLVKANGCQEGNSRSHKSLETALAQTPHKLSAMSHPISHVLTDRFFHSKYDEGKGDAARLSGPTLVSPDH